jgi:hypothetical protein
MRSRASSGACRPAAGRRTAGTSNRAPVPPRLRGTGDSYQTPPAAPGSSAWRKTRTASTRPQDSPTDLYAVTTQPEQSRLASVNPTARNRDRAISAVRWACTGDWLLAKVPVTPSQSAGVAPTSRWISDFDHQANCFQLRPGQTALGDRSGPARVYANPFIRRSPHSARKHSRAKANTPA